MNVLAIQRRRVGDILMTTPALRALKTRFPQAELTYVCERPFSAVLRSNHEVDTILPMEAPSGIAVRLRLLATLRQRRFDLALDFEGSPATALLAAGSGAVRRIGFRTGAQSLAYTDRVVLPAHSTTYLAAEKLSLLAPLGIDVRSQSLRPVLAVESRAREWANRTLDAAGIGTANFLLTLALAARAPENRWPLEHYAKLLDALATSHVFEVVLLLDAEDERMGEQLARLTTVPLYQLSTIPSLPQIAALLDRADLHVGNNNGVRHMATALGTATLGIQPAGTRRRWALPGDPLQVCLEPAGATPSPVQEGREGAPPERLGTPPERGGAPPEDDSQARTTSRDQRLDHGQVVDAAGSISRISPEEALQALLGLEAYLPRFRAARRTPAIAGPPRPRPAAPSTSSTPTPGPTPTPNDPAPAPAGRPRHSPPASQGRPARTGGG